MARDTGWSWKSEDRAQNAELDLRYEPGAWGDLLKSAWAVAIADALAEAPGPLSLLDPFAGAPDYPLVEATRARLEDLPAPRLRELLGATPARFPSTASLILAAWGERASARVFDADAARRERWEGRANVEVLALEDGDGALGPARGSSAGPTLVHVDPYDLFERFERLIPRGVAAGRSVLFYLFNKAPRSVKAHKRYLELRGRLDALLEARAERALLVGRVPSDALLPRAYHEVLFVGERELCARLEGPLGALTRALCGHVAELGAFESSLTDPS